MPVDVICIPRAVCDGCAISGEVQVHRLVGVKAS